MKTQMCLMAKPTYLQNIVLLTILFVVIFLQPTNVKAQFGNSACMGASTTKFTLNSTNVTLLSGTAGTVGVKYKFTNAYLGATSATSIDVIAELIAIQYGTVYNATRYTFTNDQIGNPPSASGFGIDGNFQPSFVAGSTAFTQPNGTNENIFSTWKFSFVLNSNNATPIYLPIIAQAIDNDGVAGSATSVTIRESVQSVTNPTAATTAVTTQETYNATTKTFLGPAVNQAGIGTGTDFIGYFYYNNVSTITLKFNHNIVVAGGSDLSNAGNSRYSSVHLGCDYTGDKNFVLQNISGNVYNDANGITDNTISGAGTNGASTLYAILYDNTSGNVLATSTVSAGGAYSFAGITPGDNYTIYLSTTVATVGQTAIPTLTPPTGYAYVGEFFGTGAGTDGTANGILPLGVVNATATNANFGIDQIPVANNYTMTAQANPGGTTTVKVPIAAFSATDAEDGAYATGLSGKKVTLNPATNGTLFYNGVAVSVSTIITNFDPNLVTIDPAGTTATAVTPTFTFSVFDAADVPSAAKTITMPLGVPAGISGSIFDDTNGDAAITAGENLTNAGGLNAALTDAAGNVIETVAISAGGLYSFTRSTASTGYKVILSTATPVVGTVLTTSSLPNPVSGTWVNTGVNPGGATPTLGNTTGILSVTTPATGSLTNQNFGIEQIPVGNNFTASAQVNPGGTGTVVVPSAAFTATDAEDGAYAAGLSGRKVTLNPATNGTLFYNGVAVNSSTTITGFNPALVTLDPAGTTQIGVTPTFTYSVFDAANQPSAAKTISVPFAAPIVLSGNVFDDSNGDASKAAGEAFTNAGGLFAVLTDASGNVIEAVAVTAGGAYTFTKAINSQNYKIVLSTTTPGATLHVSSLPNPASGTWVNTGVNPGGATPTPGNTTGIITLTTPASGDVTNQNFAIEQIPVANNYTATAQANPGGTATVTVPSAAFSATDAEDGAYASGLAGRKVTLNPATNGTLFYNGVAVNSSITITGFNPALVTIDPAGATATAVTPTFTFSVFDAANQPSAAKTISIPLGAPSTISGNIFNDPNGNAIQNVGESGTNAGGLNAVLTDASGNVIETVPVAADGTYTFTKATASTTYNVVLSTTTPTTGAVLTTSSLPTPATGNWVNTGVNPGGASPNTTNTTGILAVTTPSTGNVTNQNFAIEQIPVANNYTATSQANPGGTATVTVPSAAFSATDAEDGAYASGLAGAKVTLNPATNGTLFYNGVAVNSSTIITNFNPALVTIDPLGTGATAVTPTFTFSVFDAANQPSAAKTISIPLGTPTSISGNIFNDPNGNAIQNVGESGTNAGGLNAVLTDASGNVIETVPVAADGTYTFTKATASTTYNVVLSTTTPTTGAVLTTSSLPTPATGNWVNTGVNPGGASPNTTNTTGILAVTTPASGNVSNQNFAIEQTPATTNFTATAQANPGGTLTVKIPAAAFTGNDATEGTYAPGLSGRKITLNPATNGTLFYNGVAVNSSTTITNFDPALVTIDPAGAGTGAVTPTFTYSVFDVADKPSAPATISMAFGPGIVLSGTIFDDANGNATQNVGENGTDAGGLFAVLTDAAGNVIESVAVSGTGTYTFANATSSAAYNVILSTTSPAVGDKLTVSSLPTPATGAWVSTGVNPSGASPSTANKTGILAITTPASGDFTNQNFAIEQLPLTNTQSYNISTPTGNSFLTLNGTGAAGSPGPLLGSDAEDQPASGSLSTKNIQITMLPTNGNELYYNGAKIFFGADGSTPPSLTNPLTITNYDPSLLQLRFTGTGSMSTSFNYRYADAAGNPSANEASYTVNWASVLPVTITAISAEENNGFGLVRWTTRQETNLLVYSVERSENATTFTSIGDVNPANNASGSSYLFNDDLKRIDASVVYYRLKIVNTDGSFKYSSIVKIARSKTATTSLLISPNPVQETMQIKVNAGVSSVAVIRIISNSGQVMYTARQQVFKGMNNIQVTNLSGKLAKGTYILSVMINNENLKSGFVF